jgi:hypothetical protein
VYVAYVEFLCFVLDARRFRQEKTCLGGFAITAANCLMGKTHFHLSSGT